jgi:glycosyltransferase involved in cell wall biosynthesis
VPPQLYGGTERVVSWLTEELVAAGHDVTLYASGDSSTSATLVPGIERAIWRETRRVDPIPYHLAMIERVFREQNDYDVIHFHTDWLHFPFVRWNRIPVVTTLHGRLDQPEHEMQFRTWPEVPLISISDHQRAPMPHASWIATVHNGLPASLLRPSYAPGQYLLFLGRLSPEKRVDRAVAIAAAAGLPLKIAARIPDEDRAYFERVVSPVFDAAGSRIEFLGEVGGARKEDLLRGAAALLFPIDWPEPFGLVMIEAMACGTPVIAWRGGSVNEIVEDGINGFVVDDLDQAISVVGRLRTIDRRVCRARFEERFTSARMAASYLEVYRRRLRLLSPRLQRVRG